MDLPATHFLKPCIRLLITAALAINITGTIGRTQADNQRPLPPAAPTLLSEQMRQLTQFQQLSRQDSLSKILEQSNLTPQQKQLLAKTLNKLQRQDSIDESLRKRFQDMARDDSRFRKLAEDIARKLPLPQTPNGLPNRLPSPAPDATLPGRSPSESKPATRRPQTDDRGRETGGSNSQRPGRQSSANRTRTPDTMSAAERLREELRPLGSPQPPLRRDADGQAAGPLESPEQGAQQRTKPAGQFSIGNNRTQTPSTRNPSGSSASATIPKQPSIDWQKELSQKGVTKTFKRLIEEARKNVQSNTLSQDGASIDGSSLQSMFSRTLTTAVDHLRENAGDTITEVRRQMSSERNGRTSDATGKFNTNRNGAKPDSQSAASQPATAKPKPAPELGTDSKLPSINDVILELPNEIGAAPLFGMLLVAGLIGGILLLTTRRQPTHSPSSRPISVRPIQARQIQSREDVIRAYHWLTHSTAPDSAAWWSHHQARQSMTTWAPERSAAIEQLASLYEAARYDAQRGSFGPEHIQQARAAMAGCER